MNKKETVLRLIVELIQDKTPVVVRTSNDLLDFYVDQGSQRHCYLASLYNNEKWWFDEAEAKSLEAYVFIVNRLGYKGVPNWMLERDDFLAEDITAEDLRKKLDDIQLATICLKEKDIEDSVLVYESEKKFSLQFDKLIIEKR